MRYAKLIVAFSLIAAVLSGCSVKIKGLPNFSTADCPASLNQYLLPSETFLSDFPYLDGDYYYFDPDYRPKVIVYAQYTEETYTSAKDYCMEKFVLIENNQHEWGEYCFIENNTCHNRRGEESWYPEWFNMFGYNDTEQTLFFVGFCDNSISEEDRTLLENDFAGFLQKYFGQCYNFV